MGCFSGLWGLLVWIIVLVAMVAIVRIILSYESVTDIAARIANILLWAVVANACFCLYIVYDLLSCAILMPRLR